MRRVSVVVALVAVLAASCTSQLGRGVLECASGAGDVTNTLILAAQAVPQSEYLPCVAGLKPGWEYQHLIAETGRAQFTLDSDRMGMAFLVVTLLESCDVGDANQVTGEPAPGVSRYADVFEASVDIPITVITVADRHLDYAENVAFLYSQKIFNGRRVTAILNDSEDAIADKIAAAHEAGRDVVIVDDVDVQNTTVSMRLVGENEQSDVDRDEALAEIGEEADSAKYRARWFDVFTGGCVQYDFDAKGIGAETVAHDGLESLGLYPLEPLRQVARDAGYGGFD
jgi:hypothetical protein